VHTHYSLSPYLRPPDDKWVVNYFIKLPF
jgi:hypothetical protein